MQRTWRSAPAGTAHPFCARPLIMSPPHAWAAVTPDGGPSDSRLSCLTTVPLSAVCRVPFRSEALGSVPAHYAYLGLMIALSSSLANKSLNYVSQPVKAGGAFPRSRVTCPALPRGASSCRH